MGHAVRVMKKNPNKNVMKKMNDDSYFCVVFMDFKMHFETRKHRDNEVEFLGGEVYHVMVIWFYILFESMLSLMYMK